jgi:hypothetical protein
MLKLFKALTLVEQNGMLLDFKISKKEKGGRLEMIEEDKQQEKTSNCYCTLSDGVLMYYRQAKEVRSYIFYSVLT